MQQFGCRIPYPMSSHSPASWQALWRNNVDDTLDVQAHLVTSDQKPNASQMYDMVWSVRIV